MRYGSLCSGIEAATQAWEPLGWSPAFFSEIDTFPSAVLAHHYGSNMPDEAASANGVPNYGDMSKFERWPDHAIDVLVGGTPCQSFSVAGLRKGLADPRGNLMLTFGSIAQRYKPRWIIWENVPGVLSSNGGRDFGAFLRLLGECGYGFAYRVLDSQYVRVDGFGRAVAQRRRRVFVVGCFGDWRPAGAVLFEPESMCGDSPTRRKKGQETSQNSGAGFTQSSHGGYREGVGTLRAHGGDLGGGSETLVTDVTECQTKHAQPVAGALCRNSFSGGAGGRPEGASAGHFIPVCFNSREETVVTGSATGSLSASLPQSQAIAWSEELTASEEVAGTIQRGGSGGRHDGVFENYAIRRLTPRECERLQGFPDDFTKVPWRGKPLNQCPDGLRYKALGNSMAVNCMRWLGRRIDMVDALISEAA